MDRLLELAERCEAATGPDHVLSGDIAYAVGTYQAPDRGSPDGWWPEHTASLDAAMTLLDDRQWTAWELRSRGGLSRYVAEISRIGDDKEEELVVGHARTPALALCAAALRGRARQGSTAR